MTLALALIVMVLVQYYGIQANGAGYFREFRNPMAIIELFSRILSLSLRLFGNIFGGEVLVTVMYALTFVLVPTLFLFLELFFGFIQALVFVVLTIIFISLAATEHHGGGHAAERASTTCVARSRTISPPPHLAGAINTGNPPGALPGG